PNGTFVFTGEQAGSLALVGAGVGVTPMMSVARYLTDRSWPGRITLVLGFRSPRDFMFREEIERLRGRNPNLEVLVTMSDPGADGWAGRIGRIDAALLESVNGIASCRTHVCGPPSMMDTVKAALVGLGVPESQIRTEAFGTVTRDPSAKSARSS